MLEREFLENTFIRTGRTLILIALFGLWINRASVGEEGKPLSASEIRTYPVPSPQKYDHAINGHRLVERAKITLSDSVSVELFEQPRSIEDYDSIVKVIVSGKKPEIVRVGHLIGCPELRVVHAALVRSDSVSGALILEYEGGGIGAREGFAVLRFDRHSAQIHVLPVTNFGKVVFHRNNHEIAEIWSGNECLNIPPGAEGCEYTTRLCKWEEESYSCGQPKKMEQVFNPNDISDPGIEIQP